MANRQRSRESVAAANSSHQRFALDRHRFRTRELDAVVAPNLVGQARHAKCRIVVRRRESLDIGRSPESDRVRAAAFDDDLDDLGDVNDLDQGWNRLV